jgi:hypothetical protein
VITWRKLTKDRDCKPEKNFDLASGTSFGIRICFQKSNQTFVFNIFPKGPTKMFKTTGACRESTDLILYTKKLSM